MPARRPPLSARLATGPLAFLVAGIADVAAAWLGWGVQTLAARPARRAAR